MPHRHKIHDTDPFFSIDPFSRTLKNESNKKITLIQHDHNSERFTFVIPRFIEEHDMIECNVVQVHYINIESGNNKPNQNEDVYEVTDLHIDPDDESKVVCSWLISQNATKYVGSLNFVVRFSCVTNGVTEYAWNTAVYSGISVSSGIFNTDVIVEEYSDILAQWAARIKALEQGDFFYTKDEIDEKGFLQTRPTATYEYGLLDDGATFYNSSTRVLAVKSYSIPESMNIGAEIKDIEFVNSEGNYISIKNLYVEDGVACVPVFDKIFIDKETSAYAFAEVIVLGGSTNWITSRLNSFQSTTARITYYTD